MAKAERKRLLPPDAKARVVQLIAEGRSNAYAMAAVDRTPKAYEYWRRTDRDFAEKVDTARLKSQKTYERPPVPDFPEFCAEYLFQPLSDHQLRWWDCLNGREPRDLHPSMTYEQGPGDLLLFNVPPEHAKSTTLTMNYVTWCIVRDPNFRVLIISKTLKMAKKFLFAIKVRLKHPRYKRLQEMWGPAEGWKKTAGAWTTDMIYLTSEETEGEKDPTVQALGLGGHIYGSRADLIICDDIADVENAHRFEDHIEWLTQDVLTRVVEDEELGSGKLMVVGTRVGAKDVYSELLVQFPGEWTYLAQPAVLEYAEDEASWLCLWPRRWAGPKLARRKRRVSAAVWARAYQQANVTEDSTFPEDRVKAAINGKRGRGPLVSDAPGHRDAGMVGLYVILSMDPASSGFTAMVVYAVDRVTKRRWVLDLANERGTTPKWKRDLIKSWVEKYGVNELRVETNAYQKAIVQDDELREWLFARGVRIHEHTTGGNKWDEDFGVASMETLFLDPGDGSTLIDIPNPAKCHEAQALVDQLIAWAPQAKLVCDLVMALWFAEIRAREIVRQFRDRNTHLGNGYMSRGARKRQQVVSLEQILAEREQERQARLA